MIGILVMTHGSFSKELIRSCELIAGKTESIQYLTLNHEDNIEKLNENMIQRLNELDTGKGVLVLTDLLGGSPCNVATMNLKKNYNIQLLSGVNLPMLLEAMLTRESCTLEELALKCKQAGYDGINHINEMLK